MLPMSIANGGGGREFNSTLLPEYISRIFQYRQMDLDFAFSQVSDIILRPSELVKTVKIRKQIKNQWARDDPAFVLILIALILVSTTAYCCAFATTNPVHILRLTLGGIIFEFLICGTLLVTGVRWYINKKMRIQRIHTVEQTIELLYAWDIHTNALFAAFLLISTTQYCMMPIILAHGFLATALANTIWLAGVAYYFYITFLGYSALPFLDRPERLFYPMGFVCLFYFLLLLLNLNVSQFVLNLYFGHSHAEKWQGAVEEGPL